MANSIRCIGCGATVEATSGPIHRYMTAAPGCWALYGTLNALLLSNPDATGYRQWCVDAYAVQHPGEPSEQAIQSVAGHLISLYSTLVLEIPISKSPSVISRVTARKGHYRWLSPPSSHTMTIVDVVKDLHRLEEVARDWASASWDAWHPHHEEVKTWYAKLFVR